MSIIAKYRRSYYRCICHLWKPSHLSSATTVMMFAITPEKERNEWRKRIGDDRELPLTFEDTRMHYGEKIFHDI